jgi:hypothetical protein
VVRKHAIGREQQRASRVHVKSTNGNAVPRLSLCVKQAVYSWTAVYLCATSLQLPHGASRREMARRLVQKHVSVVPLWNDSFPTTLDLIAARMHRLRGCGAGLAVDGDAASCQQG